MKLFDENCTDDEIKIINGETTNLLNLNTIKYNWAKTYFNTLFQNNWLPEKVDLGLDKQQWKKLTNEEREAYSTILSFLVFLDSIQTNNLPNISEFITAPEVTMVLARQTFDEALHSLSYGHIGESMFTPEEFKKIVYEFRENPVLRDRILTVTEGYEEFFTEKDTRGFIKVAVNNYLLEGLMFYNSFYFFHNLASRGLMIGSDTIFKYIQRDELVHCQIFRSILLETKNENPEEFAKMVPVIYKMFEDAVELEIRFSCDTIGDKILGMTSDSIRDYSYYLGNRRLKDIGLNEIFPKNKNPYKHLDLIAGVEDETSNRANNFEVTSITYKNASVLDGWDDL